MSLPPHPEHYQGSTQWQDIRAVILSPSGHLSSIGIFFTQRGCIPETAEPAEAKLTGIGMLFGRSDDTCVKQAPVLHRKGKFGATYEGNAQKPQGSLRESVSKNWAASGYLDSLDAEKEALGEGLRDPLAAEIDAEMQRIVEEEHRASRLEAQDVTDEKKGPNPAPADSNG